jgi:hypothetical protein
MGKFLENKENFKSAKEPEVRRSEWLDTCQAVGCKLKPHASTAGHQLCGFHLGQQPGEGYRNWRAISLAIDENTGIIKKAYQLTLKATDFWSDRTNLLALQGWEFLPMEPNEWPSRYTDRLIRRVDRLIKDEATKKIELGIC